MTDPRFDSLFEAIRKASAAADGSSDSDASSSSGSGSSAGSSGGAGSGSGSAGSTGGRGRGPRPGGSGFDPSTFPFGFGFGGGRRRGSGSGGSGNNGGNGGSGHGGRGSGDGGRKHHAPGTTLAGLSKGQLVGVAVAFVLILAAAYWWFHPPISPYSEGFWAFLIVAVLVPVALFAYGKSVMAAQAQGEPVAAPAFRKRNRRGKRLTGKALVWRRVAFVPAILFVAFLVGVFASYPIFPGNAERYAKVLHTTDNDFASDIKEVDYTKIPVIDRQSASILGNRTLGSIPEYVSQFEISPIYSQINYRKAPVRVTPLVYADVFKWLANREAGIPAYVKVEMATQNTEVVRLEKGIKYSESEPLARNIDRHVQLKYPFYMFGQKSFEIDDEGKPWWIVPVLKRTIGLFGGTTIDRVVLVDAQTGDTTDLPVAECPQWVDHVYPTDLLIEQYNWSGRYKNGFINSIFGQQGVVQTTPGTNGGPGYNYIAKDDDVWVYTGVTSATADNSIVGFVLINQRTAESHFYSVAGATEASAMSSAEGQVQNLRYRATFPLLLNINGRATYFMALKDDAGLVKKYAMIDIEHYQNVAVGDTVEACQKSYKQLIAQSGDAQAARDGDFKQAAGPIRSISQAVVEGTTHFYLTLQGDPHIYDLALPGLIEVVRYVPGDAIALKYIEDSPLSTVYEIVKPDQREGGSPAGDAAANQAAKEALSAEKVS